MVSRRNQERQEGREGRLYSKSVTSVAAYQGLIIIVAALWLGIGFLLVNAGPRLALAHTTSIRIDVFHFNILVLHGAEPN